jgi:uncharacterized Zn-binding protein involved in type VI secretion
MNAGITVGEIDTAGGALRAETAPWYRILGHPVAVTGDTVEGHGDGTHAAPVMVEGEVWFRVAGRPVCRAGNAASCGHVATGRSALRLATLESSSYAELLPRRGTYFFGGAGLAGDYLSDMAAALGEAGISAPALGNRTRWQITPEWDVDPRRMVDALLGVELLRSGEVPGVAMGLEDYGTNGPQFNLVGYSYGSLIVAQVAVKYARHHSGFIDHLVLIGAPISASFLAELRGEWRIRQVVVVNLTERGDPIYAGMTLGELLFAAPVLAAQLQDGDGHFWYSRGDEVGNARRRDLARYLFGLGLR